MMPRDVTTQWNLTFDMLDFTIEHIAAVNAITSDCDMKLRQYELSKDKWDVACQLWVSRCVYYSDYFKT